jgi:hypothetical protein
MEGNDHPAVTATTQQMPSAQEKLFHKLTKVVLRRGLPPFFSKLANERLDFVQFGKTTVFDMITLSKWIAVPSHK